MCGIVGYMGTRIEESVLKNMMEQIRHRGPDGEGMFAFDIWDRTKQELFCARDYFGIKPL